MVLMEQPGGGGSTGLIRAVVKRFICGCCGETTDIDEKQVDGHKVMTGSRGRFGWLVTFVDAVMVVWVLGQKQGTVCMITTCLCGVAFE